MAKDRIKADLFARGRGICRGTTFSGDLLGQRQEFIFSNHKARIILPPGEFREGSHDPVGKSAGIVHFRSGWVDDPSPARSFFELEYVTVEIDFEKKTDIPASLLDHPAVRLSPELRSDAPHLNKLSAHYDELLVSAWHHWMRVARWATDQYTIGLPDLTMGCFDDFEMPRIHERETGYGVWASPHMVQVEKFAQINVALWEHIGRVLQQNSTPPIWFEYLVDARHRIANHDFSGSVLSSVIACETLARAVYNRLVGSPDNTTAADLVDRIAAQAIIGKWKGLTGIKAEGKVHDIFELRNKMVHSGRTDSFDAKAADDVLKTARKFVEPGDEWWFNEQGIANARTEKPES